MRISVGQYRLADTVFWNTVRIFTYLFLKGNIMATYHIFDVQQKLIKAVDSLATPVFYSGIEFDVRFAAGLLACPHAVFFSGLG
jgi:hypothetical protein